MREEINEKDLILTTLAIIGSGILGRSLVYTLAKEQKSFEKIILFHSDKFTPPCSLSSTAIVAPRGVTKGHSPLGDLMVEGYETFRDHVLLDRPEGVEEIVQYTSASSKLENFRSRYPASEKRKGLFHEEHFTADEKAFLVDPEIYLDWLLKNTSCEVEVVEDFVMNIEENERFHIKTLNGRTVSADKVVLAGGNYNRFWKGLAPELVTKPVQGSYYEFFGVEWNLPSFSLTHDGDNLVWNNRKKSLLIGSTTDEVSHLLPDLRELHDIYKRLRESLSLELPGENLAVAKTGLREKSRKREPYVVQKGSLYLAGGLYKNGFILSLKISRTLSHQLL